MYLDRKKFLIGLVLLISIKTLSYSQVKSVFMDCGFNLSKLHTKYLNEENRLAFKTNIEIGKDYQLSKYSFLYGKFGYWKKGGGYYFKNYDSHGNFIDRIFLEYSLNYLLLSLGYSFHTTGEEVIWLFNMGPYVGFLYSGDEDTFFRNKIFKTKLFLTGDRIDYGLDLSIGLQFPIVKRINLGFGFGYQFGLIKLNGTMKNITYYSNVRVVYLFIY